MSEAIVKGLRTYDRFLGPLRCRSRATIRSLVGSVTRSLPYEIHHGPSDYQIGGRQYWPKDREKLGNKRRQVLEGKGERRGAGRVAVKNTRELRLVSLEKYHHYAYIQFSISKIIVCSENKSLRIVKEKMCVGSVGRYQIRTQLSHERNQNAMPNAKHKFCGRFLVTGKNKFSFPHKPAGWRGSPTECGPS